MGLRDLPSVDALAERLSAGLRTPLPPPIVRTLARDAIEEARDDIRGGDSTDPAVIARPRVERLAALRPTRVINATGVLLHTNLGRAPIAGEAAEAAALQHTSYGNIEFDLSTGSRGGRGAFVEELLVSLTGTEAALSVNNTAGALFLALAALAAPGSVVVSRGELIEIGGSFRLPDLMAASGATLTEVGTTNRTRLADYDAVMPDAALVLKVHPSNYRIDGFAEEASYSEIASLASERGIPFVADLGSGLLDTRVPWLDGPPPAWLAGEPGARQTLEAGADVVLFSGDKLLGGPQAGIAVGRGRYIDQMRRHPIARAVRMDGPTVAALAATLELYATGRGAEIPFWRMASTSYADLEARHIQVLRNADRTDSVVAAESVPGAGSVPGETIPSPAIQLDVPADEGWNRLIEADVPLIGRRREGTLQVDLRSVDPADDPLVSDALRALS